MKAKHEFRKIARTPEQDAEIAAVRAKYQKEKPTVDEVLKESGHATTMTMGQLLEMHQIMAELKRERERRQMTLAQVAEIADLDQAQLSRLESGKAGNPTIETVNRVARALGKIVTCSLRDAPELCRR